MGSDVFSSQDFSGLGLCEALVKHIHEHLGFNRATEVQKATIPQLLTGRDLLVKADTGTGKTLAYLAPLVHLLQGLRKRVSRADGAYAIVVAPTRELCLQIHELAVRLCRRFVWVVPGYTVGGENRAKEKARLRKGVNILVATPGRLLDHLRHTAALRTERLHWLILDEADRLLDLGFEKDVMEILSLLEERRGGEEVASGGGAGPTGGRKGEGDRVGGRRWRLQRVLLSATLSQRVSRLAQLSLRSPQIVDVSGKESSGGAHSLGEAGGAAGDAVQSGMRTEGSTPACPGEEEEEEKGEEEEEGTEESEEAMGKEVVDGRGGRLRGAGSPRGSNQGRTRSPSSREECRQHNPKGSITGRSKVVAAPRTVVAAEGAKVASLPLFLQSLYALEDFLPPDGEQPASCQSSRTEKAPEGAVARAQGAPLLPSGGEDGAPASFEVPCQLEQRYIRVPCALRLVVLAAIVATKAREVSKMLVFFSTCDSVDFHYALLSRTLGPHGRTANGAGEGTGGGEEGEGAEHARGGKRQGRGREQGVLLDAPLFRLHGGMAQPERRRAFLEFRAATGGVLLCTDVAARGLDFPRVPLVLQFDPPGEATDYVHRVGRTARLGEQGEALLLLQPAESEYLKELEAKAVSISEAPLGPFIDALQQQQQQQQRKRRPEHDRSRKHNKAEVRELVDHHPACESLQRALEAAVSADPELEALAVDAFRSFVRGYAAHRGTLKRCFHPRRLHLGHVARSFALRTAPSLMGASRGKALSTKRRRAEALGRGQKNRSRMVPAKVSL